MLTIGDVLRASTEHLAAKDADNPRLDAERLLAHALGLQRVELYMHHDRPLTEAELDAARALLARRAGGEPLQYVLGEWGFRGLTLRVDGRALIPRPETETVVERCLALIAGREEPRVLDVGTGSGAIALAIADEHPGARVTALDVSDDALALAKENAERTGLAVELRRHDLFDGLPGEQWDLVVSNPPYVLEDELPTLPSDVVAWEPGVALVGRGHTDAVVRDAARALRRGGALVLEVHEGGAAAVASLLESHGFVDVRTTADLAGRDRVVEGRSARA
ncbi:MAG TPA: peptide chain release factor N(5)-glutamine methyltransferase [Gaiella sp.]|nr:peptide chain release factor N(5)-glutamine methyltransferase [Gaiella sp.]